MTDCRGYQRHWFTLRGMVGARSPKCVRCGAPNPVELTNDDWWMVLSLAPGLIDDPEALRVRLLEEEERDAIEGVLPARSLNHRSPETAGVLTREALDKVFETLKNQPLDARRQGLGWRG
jgi:hypothetical protein